MKSLSGPTGTVPDDERQRSRNAVRFGCGSELEKVLRRFEVGNAGSNAVKEIVDRANVYDIVSFWHFMSRVDSKKSA